MNNKIKILSDKFKENGYTLSSADLIDLKFQLKRKPISLYIEIINKYAEENKIITYPLIRDYIIYNKRLLNTLFPLISGIEETIWSFACGNEVEWKKYKKISIDKRFETLINESFSNTEYKNILHEFRKLRNWVSHCIYIDLDFGVGRIVSILNSLKNLPFIEIESINSIIDKILNCKDDLDNLK